MNCEAVIEKLVEEMIEKKFTHDAMVLAYRGVVVVDGMEQFFNVGTSIFYLSIWAEVKPTVYSSKFPSFFAECNHNMLYRSNQTSLLKY